MIAEKTTPSSHPVPDLDTHAAAGSAPLSADVLRELFDYVEEGLAITGCDHSFRCSEAFLVANGIALRPTLTWLRRYGARCDCETLDEVQPRWLPSSRELG